MKHTLPPGTYYIGDVTLRLSPFNNLLNNYIGCHTVKNAEGNSFQYVVAPTYHKSGIFEGSDGKPFVVVKQNIGMVPIYLLDEEKLDDEDSDIHQELYEFKDPVTFSCLYGLFKITSKDFELVINSKEYSTRYPSR